MGYQEILNLNINTLVFLWETECDLTPNDNHLQVFMPLCHHLPDRGWNLITCFQWIEHNKGDGMSLGDYVTEDCDFCLSPLSCMCNTRRYSMNRPPTLWKTECSVQQLRGTKSFQQPAKWARSRLFPEGPWGAYSLEKGPQKIKPQGLWDSKCYFKPLSLGIICYAVLAN